jgi:hypothetical protein
MTLEITSYIKIYWNNMSIIYRIVSATMILFILWYLMFDCDNLDSQIFK